MAKLYDIKEEAERAILVAVSQNDRDDTKESVEELAELVKTAGAITVGVIIQNREAVHLGTYVGKGKIDEIRQLAEEQNADCIICDDELTPAQLKNLSDLLPYKVCDRTSVILDIFAQHASTREGKIQVELAQLKYRATRLIGMRSSLSRLGGGIGTRGPGEKKLEIDRRLIKDRIVQLHSELEEIKKNRETARKQREKNAIPVIAIVGYTNAGKSTLLNYLTQAKVLEADMLFATLDPTTRNLTLESGQQVLLTDTVGFIRKLPHHLIDAFRSTLEEAKYADMILHVVDASSPNAMLRMHIVYDTLRTLGVTEKTIITVFNKQDLVSSQEVLKDLRADYAVDISAKNGQGVDKMLETIEEILRNQKAYVEHIFSYQDAGNISQIRKYGQLLEEEYREEGIFVRAYIPKNLANQLNII